MMSENVAAIKEMTFFVATCGFYQIVSSSF